MITLRPGNERGHAIHGWLDSWHTFSFADYHDPRHMGFRSLRVINDDIIAPGMGFGTHPHRDMEIITYILEGALEHKDSMGNGEQILPGEIQYMSAGSGVEHSEFNPSPIQPAHLLQIWIQPHQKGAKPQYGKRKIKTGNGPVSAQLIVSPDGRDDSVKIRQDANLHLVTFQKSAKWNHDLAKERHAWVQVTRGQLELNGVPMKAGDGAAVSEESKLQFSADGKAEALLFDLN